MPKSYGELLIESWLNELGYKFEMEKCFSWLKSKKSLRCDFYIPAYHTVIEVDGMQHYKDTGFGDFEQRKMRDAIKDKLCTEHSMQVIRIPYDKLGKINKKYLDYLIKKQKFGKVITITLVELGSQFKE